jgi:hypothetical protein
MVGVIMMKTVKDICDYFEHTSEDYEVGFSLSKGCGNEFLRFSEIKVKKIKKTKDMIGNEEYIVTDEDDLEYDFYAIVFV